jgi:hypothetical protein
LASGGISIFTFAGVVVMLLIANSFTLWVTVADRAERRQAQQQLDRSGVELEKRQSDLEQRMGRDMAAARKELELRFDEPLKKLQLDIDELASQRASGVVRSDLRLKTLEDALASKVDQAALSGKVDQVALDERLAKFESWGNEQVETLRREQAQSAAAVELQWSARLAKLDEELKQQVEACQREQAQSAAAVEQRISATLAERVRDATARINDLVEKVQASSVERETLRAAIAKLEAAIAQMEQRLKTLETASTPR